MSAKRLRDCRGFVETINELCTCGGNDAVNGCAACKVYHAIADWEVVGDGGAAVTSSFVASVEVEK